MNKIQLEETLLTLITDTDLLKYIKYYSYVLYGEYLAVLLLNHVWQLQISLPTPTVWKVTGTSYVEKKQEYYSTHSKSIVDIYLIPPQDLSFVYPNYQALPIYTNFNTCLVSYSNTGTLYAYIDTSFIQLLTSKQLEYVSLCPVIPALSEIYSLSKKYQDYVYVDIKKVISMAKDVSSVNYYTIKELMVSSDYASTLQEINGVTLSYITPNDYPAANLIQVTLPAERLLPLDLFANYIADRRLSHTRQAISKLYLQFVEYLYGPNVRKFQREIRLEVLSHTQLAEYALAVPDYLSVLPAGWKEKLAVLSRFLADHEVSKHFKGLTLNSQLQRLTELKTFINEYGLWIIGLLENIPLYSKEEFAKTIKFKILENTKWMVEPATLPSTLPFGLSSKYQIHELVTRQELIQEGEYQNHCVGGYSVNETHRIFSIRRDKFRITVEYSFNNYSNNLAWQMVQAKGKHNKRANSYDAATVRELEIILDFLVRNLPKPHPASFNF